MTDSQLRGGVRFHTYWTWALRRWRFAFLWSGHHREIWQRSDAPWAINQEIRIWQEAGFSWTLRIGPFNANLVLARGINSRYYQNRERERKVVTAIRRQVEPERQIIWMQDLIDGLCPVCSHDRHFGYCPCGCTARYSP